MIFINLLPKEKKDWLTDQLKRENTHYKKELCKKRANASNLNPGDKIYSLTSGRFIGKFRRGPVHGTSNKYWKVNEYRDPCTTQEIRYNEYHTAFIRGRRRNLPTTWDDIYRSDHKKTACWKNNTKSLHQWDKRK